MLLLLFLYVLGGCFVFGSAVGVGLEGCFKFCLGIEVRWQVFLVGGLIHVTVASGPCSQCVYEVVRVLADIAGDFFSVLGYMVILDDFILIKFF